MVENGHSFKSISDLEVVQANMGAFILGVSKFSAHIGIINELGWPSIRSIIYERKLNYFHRVNNLEETMLVHKAMKECFQAEKKNKYMLEIKDIIEQCEVPELSSGKKGREKIKEQIFKWNERIDILKTAEKPSLKWQPKENVFTGRQLYVDGSTEARILARFRLGSAIPREQKQSNECVLCNEHNGNNESHLVVSCKNTERIRSTYEFEKWRSMMELQNESEDVVLRKYLGDDGQIIRNKFLERGSVLMEFLSHRNRFLDDRNQDEEKVIFKG